jgi:hypothetical protein
MVIALRGLQTSLTAMSGGSAKNSGFTQFDGTSLGYLRFRQRWNTFQELYYASTPESELVDILHDRCMKKEMADRIRQEETVEGCCEMLGKFYHRPMKAAEDLVAEITAFKKMRGTEYDRLFEYYTTLRTRIGEAEREGLSYLLLQPQNLILMKSVLPTREQELWRNAQGDERSPDLGRVFKEFIAERESWVRRQVAHSTAPPLGHKGHCPEVKTKRAANTGSSHIPAAKKLARKKTKGRSSGQADGATLKSRARLKQGALTTTLATAAAPSAASEGPWGCCVAKCQQPRH